jgi:lysozyme family protein/LysM repeat protein
VSNSQKQITAGFILLDFNSKLLKNIEYKVTIVKNYKESHLVKGKTNSKGETYEFVKPINTNVCLYVKIGTKDFQKIACLPLPSTEKSKLKIRARVSAILIDSQLRKHGDSAGSIKRKDYQVVAGDTLEGIAKRHNTSVVELKNLNPKINNINKIYAGKWIKVPFNGGDKERSVDENTEANKITTITYKVKSGDTLSKIAERSGESVSDLEKINNISNRHEIREGQVLKINSKAQSSSEKNDKDWKDKINDGLDSLKDSVKDTVDNIKDKLGDLDNDTLGNNNPPASKPSIPTPTPTKPKVDIPDVELNKNSGNNQKGNPAEQITYDSKTTVYHIYYDGRIERANGQAVGYAAFIYYDEAGNKHYLGKTKYIKKGSSSVHLVNIGGDKTSDGVDDNNISVADKEKRLSKYRKGNVGYNIFMNSAEYQRYYLSGVVMAAFLGALCKLGYDDISFNGASKIDGSPGPSSSHINGVCVDMRYLRKDKKALDMILGNRDYNSQYDHDRNVKLVNTMHDFGWGKRKRTKGSIVKMLSVYFTNTKAGIDKRYILPHCGPYEGHDNHLHLQGLVANIKDIDVIHKRPENENAQPTNDCTKKFHKISKIILRHEGGYVDDPTDKGGKTNMGIAWKTWLTYAKSDLGLEPTTSNLKNITSEQAEIIYRKRYWEPKGFCKVVNDKVGLMIYDWTITSGGAGKEVQKLLTSEFKQDIGIIDGAIGSKTIQAVNNIENQKLLLERIAAIRREYYHMLVKNRPKNSKYIKGWLNRVESCLNANI